jgi:hypothetical protein
VGLHSIQIFFNHPTDTGHRFEQLIGKLPNRLHPSLPVPELSPDYGSHFPLINTLEHQPYFIGHGSTKKTSNYIVGVDLKRVA